MNIKQAAEMYTEEYYFETPVQFFMAGADIGSREIKEKLERMEFRLMRAKYIIKELLDFDFLPEVAIKKQAEQFISEVENDFICRKR